MAGHPFLWKISGEIEQRGGEPWFFGLVADGVRLKQIAEQLGCSRPLLYAWFDLAPARERRLALRAAREVAAASSTGDTGLAPSGRKRFGEWLAAKYGNADGDERGGVAIAADGAGHASVLRGRLSPDCRPKGLPAVPVAEATIDR